VYFCVNFCSIRDTLTPYGRGRWYTVRLKGSVSLEDCLLFPRLVKCLLSPYNCHTRQLSQHKTARVTFTKWNCKMCQGKEEDSDGGSVWEDPCLEPLESLELHRHPVGSHEILSRVPQVRRHPVNGTLLEVRQLDPLAIRQNRPKLQ
jgi:hypothetical protein